MQTLGAMGLAEAGKDFGVTQAERQAAKRNAFRNCVRYAQQTKSRMVRLRQAGFHGDPHSRMLSWRKGILRSHGSPEEVPR